MNSKDLKQKALSLLKELIRTPSFSGKEAAASALVQDYLRGFGIPFHTAGNNVWALNRHYDPVKPTVLLNSHLDTVKPNKGYTRDPFKPEVEKGKLYGLGSNDAGGPLVSLLSAFAWFYDRRDMNCNLVMTATAEEESSGPNGLNSLLATLPEIDFAVVGEPTGMQPAIAEKGLLVIDGYAPGKAGHAAHSNTDNAIYNALDDINRLREVTFEKISPLLGQVKVTVTQIEAGQQHNVVPASCHFVVDVRVNEKYTNREVFDMLDKQTKSKLVARSFHLNSSSISPEHPFVQAAVKLGRKPYGSPTLSDQSVLSCPSLKMGPGDSTRSHSANEYIGLDELDEGIELFIAIFEKIL
ncbi:MAG TPA: M20/M25/M40 family metallo-hydrolase [Bacteroidetes bacterium]|nr:M20/M25/M40 family metallo-hydrolase [Bacteroidota bacterium]